MPLGSQPTLVVDGRQLAFPRTGLAVLTEDLVHALAESADDRRILLLLDGSRPLEGRSFATGETVTVMRLRRRPRRLGAWLFLGRLLAVPDHFERMAWAHFASHAIAALPAPGRLFVPYFFNYGRLRSNVVLVPDLIHQDPGLAAPLVRARFGLGWRHRLPIRRLLQAREESAVVQAHRIVAYSRFVADQVQSKLHVAPDRIVRITVGLPRWVSELLDHQTTQSLRRRYELPDRFAVYVGGFAARKNVAFLLEVIDQLHALEPSFRCAMVGLADEAPRLERLPPFSTLLERPHVRQAVIPLPSLPRAELSSLYHLSSFVAYPSLEEGLGLPVLEAAAAGKVCLCGDNSALREVQAEPFYRVDSLDRPAWIQRLRHVWSHADALPPADVVRESFQRFRWQPAAETLWQALLP